MTQQQYQALGTQQITRKMQHGFAAVGVDASVTVQVAPSLAVCEVFNGGHDHFQDVDAVVADGYGQVRCGGRLAAAEASAGHLQSAGGEPVE